MLSLLEQKEKVIKQEKPKAKANIFLCMKFFIMAVPIV